MVQGNVNYYLDAVRLMGLFSPCLCHYTIGPKGLLCIVSYLASSWRERYLYRAPTSTTKNSVRPSHGMVVILVEEAGTLGNYCVFYAPDMFL